MPALVRNDWTALATGTDPTPAATVREWRRLLSFGPALSYKPGTRLLYQSSPARTIYLIESGMVKLSRLSASGRELTMLLRFPGDFVGTYGALLRLPHFVSAITVMPCQISAIPAETALDLFRTNPQAACFLSERQTVDAVRIHSLLMEQRYISAAQRFCRLLLQIATATGSVRPPLSSWVSVRVPLSEAAMADLIAMNHSAFSRLKHALMRNGDLQQESDVFSFSRHLAETDIYT